MIHPTQPARLSVVASPDFVDTQDIDKVARRRNGPQPSMISRCLPFIRKREKPRDEVCFDHRYAIGLCRRGRDPQALAAWIESAHPSAFAMFLQDLRAQSSALWAATGQERNALCAVKRYTNDIDALEKRWEKICTNSRHEIKRPSVLRQLKRLVSRA